MFETWKGMHQPRTRRMVKERFFLCRPLIRYLCWIWIMCVIVGSLLPLRMKIALGTTSHLHRPLHMFVFGSAAVVLLLLSNTLRQRLTSVLCILALAAFLEILQFWITYQPKYSAFEWRDLLDDGGGIVIAVVLSMLIKLRPDSMASARRTMRARRLKTPLRVNIPALGKGKLGKARE
jgi:hypothetical protein